MPAETVNGLFRDAGGQFPGLVELLAAARCRRWKSWMNSAVFQLLEIRSSLPDELLMYADKLSMAHSLEARVPYLDRTVVEYAQRLDASFKIRARRTQMAAPAGVRKIPAARRF